MFKPHLYFQPLRAYILFEPDICLYFGNDFYAELFWACALVAPGTMFTEYEFRSSFTDGASSILMMAQQMITVVL